MGIVGIGEEVVKFSDLVFGQVGQELIDGVFVGIEPEYVQDVWFQFVDVVDAIFES